MAQSFGTFGSGISGEFPSWYKADNVPCCDNPKCPLNRLPYVGGLADQVQPVLINHGPLLEVATEYQVCSKSYVVKINPGLVPLRLFDVKIHQDDIEIEGRFCESCYSMLVMMGVVSG